MSSQNPAPAEWPPHYPNRAERAADGWAHIAGLAGGVIGGLILLGLALGLRRWGEAAAFGVYGACLVAMFACLGGLQFRRTRGAWPVLRRLDHAAIFLMIAGSYTPFTTQRLTGAWAVGMTGAVWTMALAGAAGKLFLPGLGKGFWVVLYLALGWVALSGDQAPAGQRLAGRAVLLLVGGLIYSAGIPFYLGRTLPFRRAIWHGFVVIAAATQYAAVLTGVVLA